MVAYLADAGDFEVPYITFAARSDRERSLAEEAYSRMRMKTLYQVCLSNLTASTETSVYAASPNWILRTGFIDAAHSGCIVHAFSECQRGIRPG